MISVDPAVGAVASQAWTNRALRGRLLAALREGRTAADAVASVPRWDEGYALRQVAALAWTSPGAARSGEEISAWAGHSTTTDAVLAGNLLTGPEVLEAMSAAWVQTRGDLADRLIEVLRAGEEAGGDARGRQSGAVLVASPAEVVLDLRVDDHDDPIAELARLRDLSRIPVEVPSTDTARAARC